MRSLPRILEITGLMTAKNLLTVERTIGFRGRIWTGLSAPKTQKAGCQNGGDFIEILGWLANVLVHPATLMPKRASFLPLAGLQRTQTDPNALRRKQTNRAIFSESAWRWLREVSASSLGESLREEAGL
jgi:hypothetical protein